MFDHVSIRVSDLAASRRFYGAVFELLDFQGTPTADDHNSEWDDFSLSDAPPVTRGLHIGFGAPSLEHVDGFWETLTAAGFRDDGRPGPRPEYGGDYYGAFVLDPDGNSVEAVRHGTVRPDLGNVDHLWIRVRDVAASRAFYETIAESAGIRLVYDSDERVRFTDGTSSFSVVAGTPLTENVHVAFGASDDETVRAFHRVAVAAGYRDNGAPGERPQYHAGYYGAFVLDPDGNNVEVVHHHRD